MMMKRNFYWGILGLPILLAGCGPMCRFSAPKLEDYHPLASPAVSTVTHLKVAVAVAEIHPDGIDRDVVGRGITDVFIKDLLESGSFQSVGYYHEAQRADIVIRPTLESATVSGLANGQCRICDAGISVRIYAGQKLVLDKNYSHGCQNCATAYGTALPQLMRDIRKDIITAIQ